MLLFTLVFVLALQAQQASSFRITTTQTPIRRPHNHNININISPSSSPSSSCSWNRIHCSCLFSNDADDKDNDIDSLFSSDDKESDQLQRPTPPTHTLPPLSAAISKFKANPKIYLSIPLTAAFVGWLTNWLAVQMIFSPVKFVGLPILVREGSPLGLIGWQGIVPAKSKKMSHAMVDMVTTQLLDVQTVFKRLDPRAVAKLLSPEVAIISKSTMAQTKSIPAYLNPPLAIYSFNHRFLTKFVRAMQANIVDLVDLKSCVTDQMLADRSLLGKLFQKCGSVELKVRTELKNCQCSNSANHVHNSSSSTRGFGSASFWD